MNKVRIFAVFGIIFFININIFGQFSYSESENKICNSTIPQTSENYKFSSYLSDSLVPNWGVGIRLGDPLGLSIKKYSGKNALELNLGRSQIWYKDRWYDNRFHDWYYDQKYIYKDFQYLGYDRTPPICIQLHFLVQNEISKIGEDETKGLFWYYGFGGQLRYQEYTFYYRYKLEGSPLWYYPKEEKVTDIDLGADGVIGIEYIFPDAPLTLFLDCTLFFEIIDNPFMFWFQGGVGVRVNF